MAYLDTGELPWDMDLFDGQTEKQVKKTPFTEIIFLTVYILCIVLWMYVYICIENTVMVGPGKPAIPCNCVFVVLVCIVCVCACRDGVRV